MGVTAKQLADALRSQESGGGSDPGLTNGDSGAFGPWQIMPANWPSWAQRAGLPADAPKTLDNQQRVVMSQIQGHLDSGYSPQDVAAIWYSGQPLGANADVPQGGGKYPSIRQYANSIAGKLGLTTLPDDPNRKFTLDQIPNADPNATPTYTQISAGGKAVDPAWLTKYATVYSQWKPLHTKLAGYVDASGKPIGDVYPDAQGGLSVRVPRIDANGVAQPNQFDVKQIFNPAEYQSYIGLDTQLSSLEGQQDPQSLDDAIKQATFSYNSDPRNIDAENAAKKYARDLSATNTAVGMAQQQVSEQAANQKDAVDGYNKWVNTPSWGQVTATPRSDLESPDSVFGRTVKKVKDSLPDVPDTPYYDPAQRAAATAPHTPFDPTTLRAGIDAQNEATTAAIGGFNPRKAATTAAEATAPSAAFQPKLADAIAPQPGQSGWSPFRPGGWANGGITGSILNNPANTAPSAPTTLAPPTIPRPAPRPFSFQAFGGGGR